MKLLAVVTENFEFYHDIVRKLKRRKVSFVSLGLGDEIPSMVEAVITTSAEEGRVRFSPVFSAGYEEHEPDDRCDNMEMAIDRAQAHMLGKSQVELLVVGIDPGKRPGLAVLGDAVQLKTLQVDSPENVGRQVGMMARTYRPAGVLVRLGDGAPTQRDRILNDLASSLAGSGQPVMVEVVDETSSSDSSHGSDTRAAMKIALTPGRPVQGWREVKPTEGEIKEVQRRSRIQSEGEVTISKELAELVLLGDIDMAEAVRRQRAGD